MTLATTLYKSYRRSAKRDEPGIYDGPMVTLVRNLEDEAKRRGLNVSRWQTNSKRNSHCVTVTWMVHRGKRAAQARYIAEPILWVVFDGTEGKTPRCRAYRQLSKLYERLKALPE